MVMHPYPHFWTLMPSCALRNSTGRPSSGSCNSPCPLPSECMAKPSNPLNSRLSTAPRTMAPAPSPKRMEVLRSSQSTHLESASAPTTRTRRHMPVCRNCEAVTIPNMKPEHAAVRSKATALQAPILAATVVASPKRSSGDEVARSTMSTSLASHPASCNAASAAAAARWARPPLLVSCSPKMCRVTTPVRMRTHSSGLSTTERRSAFVTWVVGTAQPMPRGTDKSRERPGTGRRAVRPAVRVVPAGSTNGSQFSASPAGAGT
mmetsp:Transcript_63878/g.181419  ORF Transcript_63878/g.181419 Transcript_63878/m.181419 type:complete len:263 (-) Transcript_63878:232-1020(-)